VSFSEADSLLRMSIIKLKKLNILTQTLFIIITLSVLHIVAMKCSSKMQMLGAS